VPPLESRQQRLLQVLRGRQPLFAVLDAARDPRIRWLIVRSQEQYESLYEGTEGRALEDSGPYLVRLPPDSQLLEPLIREGWGHSWGVYLTCLREFRDVRRQLRRLLMVKIPDGRRVYFRFYDPRILRVFLPTCTPVEANAFYGPVGHYLMESEEPDVVVQFTNRGAGAERTEMSLDAQQRAAAEMLPSRAAPARSGALRQVGEGFKIRPEQMRVLADVPLRNFQERVRVHLNKFFPKECRALGEAPMRELIRFGIKRANAYGLAAERDVSKYIDLMVVLGREFDTDKRIPWAAEILRTRQNPATMLLALREAAKRHLESSP